MGEGEFIGDMRSRCLGKKDRRKWTCHCEKAKSPLLSSKSVNLHLDRPQSSGLHSLIYSTVAIDHQ